MSSAGGSLFVSLAFTPIIGTLDACKRAPLVVQPGSAAYRLIVRKPFTMLGLPTVRATIDTDGPYGQLATLLSDVSPSGTQRLVSREATGCARIRAGGSSSSSAATVTASSAAISYRLEVGPKDPIVRRTSNGKFNVRVSDLSVALPTRERRPNQP